MVIVGSGDSGTGESGSVFLLISVDESVAGDGGLLSVPSGSSLLRNDGIVTMVGGASLIRSGGDASLSEGSSAGGIEGAVRLASGSGRTIIGFGLLIGGRGGSDIG